MARNISSVTALVVLFLCAACAAEPTPTPTSSPVPLTLPYNPSVAPDVRATLPPTWTPTLTLPLSLVWTPTIAPSPTSTRTVDDLCATLEVDFPFEDDTVFAPDDTLLIFFGTTEQWWQSQIQAATPTAEESSSAVTIQATRPPAVLTEPVTVRFLAVHRETGENLGAQVAGGELMVLQLPISQLPLSGTYDWTVTIYVGSLGEQCARTGTFVVAEGTDEP
jgi:hypothetical protein